MSWGSLGACVAALVCALEGGSNENLLALGRAKDACEPNPPPACAVAPRCVLDANEYISGKFPGAKRFVVRTEGAAQLKFLLLLENAKGSGTGLLLRVQEATCSDLYVYDNAGRDVVRLANADGIITIPLQVTRAGDHPVELTSDAYLDWSLVVEIENVETTCDR